MTGATLIPEQYLSQKEISKGGNKSVGEIEKERERENERENEKEREWERDRDRELEREREWESNEYGGWEY